MLFHDVAVVFDKIEQESSRVKVTELLAELFGRATPHEAEILAYLSLGMLRPPYKGYNFNFAEKSMKEVVARVLDITPQTVARHVTKIGDLGAVVAEGDWKARDSLTLLQVYHALEEFEQLSGSGSIEEKTEMLVGLIKKLDPDSACYLVRIVVQKLRLGFSEMTVLDALSWMLAGNKSLRKQLEYAFNVSADIGLIARLARDGGIAAIDKIAITVGVPIRMTAAERLPTAQTIIKKVGHCIAQPKFDGFRLQVHIDNRGKSPKIHFFSRNLLDMSHMFPDLRAAVEGLKVETLIMEGEALAIDEQTGTFYPFQETVKRRRKRDIEEMAGELPLKLELFDILYLDGKSLLDHGEENRLHALKQIIRAHKSPFLAVTDEIKIEDAKQLEDFFNQEVGAGLEGVMIKRPNAPYEPGKRNFNWIKLKRTMRGELNDTIDAVVLGYYHGRGKRAHLGIGAILIGVYDAHHDRFETIAKIGTGLSDEDWVEMRKKCDAIAVKSAPHNVYVAKELVPDVWASPELVIVVKADEITRSPIHTAGETEKESGFALRFPRFVEYREDKSPTEATSVAEIKRFFSNQKLVSEDDRAKKK
ncbi:MAG: ATP-dependent DNA ligase [Candidatus Dependentiae bacterium]|nr:ATP-dependent DNA ligase [Candidatus Dependentiae bacterium]